MEKKAGVSNKNALWNSIEWGENAKCDPTTADIKDTRLPNFKNYVNTVYNIVDTTTRAVIEGEDGGESKPVYPKVAGLQVKDYSLSALAIDINKEADGCYLPAAQYQSMIFMPTKSVLIKSLNVAFQVNPLMVKEKEVKIEILGRYYGCLNTDPSHVHSNTCKKGLLEATLGTVKITPSTGNNPFLTDYAISINFDPDENSSGSNGLTEAGLKQLYLEPFINNTASTERVMLNEHSLFAKYFKINSFGENMGTRVYYQDDTTDFFEIVFDVVSEHETPVCFNIAMPVFNFEPLETK